MSKTVNFIDAINSGKRFRVKSTFNDNEYFNDFSELYENLFGSQNETIAHNLINTQFELEEEKITITETDLSVAWSIARMHDTQNGLAQLKNALGFK